MSAPHAERLVDEYLERLDSALAGVPADRREEIVGEIRSHIAEERARLRPETEADLHNLLDRLGDPEELAAAARPEPTSVEPVASSSGVGAIEVLALVLTPLIWPVGVILYWTSAHWRTRDKLIATFVPPGGYPALLFFLPILMLSDMHAGGCATEYDGQGNVISQQCFGWDALPGWEQFLINAASIAVLFIVLTSPVLIGIYMARQLRKESRGSTPSAHPGGAALGQVGLLEILAMVLTPIIWPVGVLLYWISPQWTTRDKVIATLIPPGGYAGLAVFIPAILYGGGHSATLTSAPYWAGALVIALLYTALAFVLMTPVVVGIYMARQLTRRLNSRATEAADLARAG